METKIKICVAWIWVYVNYIQVMLENEVIHFLVHQNEYHIKNRMK